MTDVCCAVVPYAQQAETIRWSNHLVNAPAVYSLLEKRVLYYLTLQIKHRFVEQGLEAPETWSDLFFHLTDKDLGVIGGQTHVLQTYEALSDIGQKFMEVQYYNKQQQLIRAKIHWVDAFTYNTATKQYEVRISPEVMPYLINLANGFTKFSAQTALTLKSKYSQKFYEFCCEYSGDFRYPRSKSNDVAFKKNIYPITVEHLRYLLGLSEQIDERTGKVKTKGKYSNFSDLKRSVLLPAQHELYELYHQGQSEVWFDCLPFQKQGRKVVSVLLFIYTKVSPKQGLPKIWDEQDEPLNPFESFTQASLRASTTQSTTMPEMEHGTLQLVEQIRTLLSQHLESNEVTYYMNYIQHHRGFTYDTCHQVLQVIQTKVQQAKFKAGTKAFKRQALMHYALAQNLQAYGWSIPQPIKQQIA